MKDYFKRISISSDNIFSSENNMEQTVYPTFPLTLWSEEEPWMTRVKCVSSPFTEFTYTAFTEALLAAGFPTGAP